MDNLVGQTIGGRYRFEAFLGRGGMASVYKVWDYQRSASLAMKMLHSDLAEDKVFVRRFRREAETLAQLQHPSIIRFYGLEEIDGKAFILMDFVEGSSLRSEISRASQPLPARRILEVLRPVCSALNYAHRLGVVHCDMKPANILIDNAGKAYVSDFGIARVMEHATTVTLAGAGTPAYMAPEQIRGLALSPQSDLYALGIILYEMLTGGERPFTGDTAPRSISTVERVRWEHLNLQPDFPPEFKTRIAPQVAAVVLRSLEKAPERRFATAMDLLLALERAMASAVEQQLGEQPAPAPASDLYRTEVLQPSQTVAPPEPTAREAPPPFIGPAAPPYEAGPPLWQTGTPPPVRKPPTALIAALFVLLLLATCGVGLFALAQTPWAQALLNIGGAEPAENAPVSQRTPDPAGAGEPTPAGELLPLDPQPEPSATEAAAASEPAAPTQTPQPPTATVPPTATGAPTPRAYDFETCAEPCNGSNAQQRFPGGINEIYFRYRFENIPTGSHYIRTWEVVGKEPDWVRYDCTWPGPESGELDLRLFDNEGLQSGTWVMTIEVDGVVLLREEVVLTGNFNLWTPAGTFNTCTGRR